MVNLKNIEIFKTYQGDGDGFVRSATVEEKSIMSYNEWSFVDNIIQDLKLIENDLASQTYLNVVNQRLRENCDSEETIQELKKIAYDM